MMLTTEITNVQYKLSNQLSGRDQAITSGAVAEFLHTNLGEYGDAIEDINKAIDYVFDKVGGFVLVQYYMGNISGVVVVNETGMGGYIPENILVYIAVDSHYRGKGLGKSIMESAIKACRGDIALHVEKDNPARFLYEKMGFNTPYLEMRLKR